MIHAHEAEMLIDGAYNKQTLVPPATMDVRKGNT
jgi:hypothetical protein